MRLIRSSFRPYISMEARDLRPDSSRSAKTYREDESGRFEFLHLFSKPISFHGWPGEKSDQADDDVMVFSLLVCQEEVMLWLCGCGEQQGISFHCELLKTSCLSPVMFGPRKFLGVNVEV